MNVQYIEYTIFKSAYNTHSPPLKSRENRVCVIHRYRAASEGKEETSVAEIDKAGDLSSMFPYGGSSTTDYAVSGHAQ